MLPRTLATKTHPEARWTIRSRGLRVLREDRGGSVDSQQGHAALTAVYGLVLNEVDR